MNSGRLVVASCNVQLIQNIQKAQSRIVAEGKPQAVFARAGGWTGRCRPGLRLACRRESAQCWGVPTAGTGGSGAA